MSEEQARNTESGKKLRETVFADDECGNCWRFGNVGLRSIVIAHGKEDAFHIPLKVILCFIARNSSLTVDVAGHAILLYGPFTVEVVAARVASARPAV